MRPSLVRAFIFRNVFVGAMVKNFSVISEVMKKSRRVSFRSGVRLLRGPWRVAKSAPLRTYVNARCTFDCVRGLFRSIDCR